MDKAEGAAPGYRFVNARSRCAVLGVIMALHVALLTAPAHSFSLAVWRFSAWFLLSALSAPVVLFFCRKISSLLGRDLPLLFKALGGPVSAR